MKNKENHDLYVNMVMKLQENGASDKEVFALLLSLCTDYLSQILDAIIEAEKQIMESNCQILEDIDKAEKKIKENTNDKKTTI